jgi:hypothetical protein
MKLPQKILGTDEQGRAYEIEIKPAERKPADVAPPKDDDTPRRDLPLRACAVLVEPVSALNFSSKIFRWGHPGVGWISGVRCPLSQGLRPVYPRKRTQIGSTADVC